MRKIHRWLSVLFGIFLLWIATTGVMSQVAELVANGGFEEAESAKPSPRTAPAPTPTAALAATPATAAFACPEDMTCRPKAPPSEARAWVGYLHHLHSGSEFGPAGVVISTLSGLALMFFAFSGLYMFLQIYRRRSHRHSHPRKVFW